MFVDKLTPVGTMSSITLSGTAQTITPASGLNYSHCLVQCRDNGQSYTNSREIAFYTVDGNTTPAINTGFVLGDGDYRMFERAEVLKGIKFITGQTAKTGKITIQFYND